MNITSPNFPKDYGNNEDIEWQVIAPTGSKVMVQFDGFDLEQGNRNDGTYSDSLIVYHGLTNSRRDRTLRAYLSGSILPENISSIGSYLWLQFTSDGSVTEKGFSLSVRAVKPDWACEFRKNTCGLIINEGSWTIGEQANYYYIEADENASSFTIPHAFTSEEGSLSFVLYQASIIDGFLNVTVCKSQDSLSFRIPFGRVVYEDIQFSCSEIQDVEVKFTESGSQFTPIRVDDIQLFEISGPSTAQSARLFYFKNGNELGVTNLDGSGNRAIEGFSTKTELTRSLSKYGSRLFWRACVPTGGSILCSVYEYDMKLSTLTVHNMTVTLKNGNKLVINPTTIRIISNNPCEPNPCKNGGTCEDGRCTCPIGKGGMTCEDDYTAQIFIGDFDPPGILYASLPKLRDDTNIMDTTFTRIPLQEVDGDTVALVIDYDPDNEMVYWSSRTQIIRIRLNGTDQEVVVPRVDPPRFALDLVNGKIYYMILDDIGSNTIAYANLDGSSEERLFNSGVDRRVETILVDPVKG